MRKSAYLITAFDARLREAAASCADLCDTELHDALRSFWILSIHDTFEAHEGCPHVADNSGAPCQLTAFADEIEEIFKDSDASFDTFCELFQTAQQLLGATLT